MLVHSLMFFKHGCTPLPKANIPKRTFSSLGYNLTGGLKFYVLLTLNLDREKFCMVPRSSMDWP